jgi:hypothetical protein
MDKEKDGMISFLDTLIIRNREGLKTTVFRKDTASDRYLDFSSCNPSSVKWGIVSCLKKRAERICSEPEDCKKEMEGSKEVFLENGYPSRTLNRILKKKGVSKVKEKKEKVLVLPYFPGFGERIRRAVAKLGIGVWFKGGTKLSNLLCNTKLDRVPPMKRGGVIYSQKCQGCEKVYVGETGRQAEVRMKEHKKDLETFNMRSAIAEHCFSEDHKVNFQDFCVIGYEKDWKRRKIKESLEIMKRDTFNRDSGVQVDRRWKPFLT